MTNTITPAVRKKLVSRLNRDAELLEDHHPQDARDCEHLAARIAPHRRAKKTLPDHSRPARPMTTGEVHAACMERMLTAGKGLCEACQCPFTLLDPPERDHYLGGWGRRKQQDTFEGCWIIHKWKCHENKTHNEPSVAFWNAIRKAFCDRMAELGISIPFVPRLEKQAFTRKSR